jgi:hypothetical protein
MTEAEPRSYTSALGSESGSVVNPLGWQTNGPVKDHGRTLGNLRNIAPTSEKPSEVRAVRTRIQYHNAAIATSYSSRTTPVLMATFSWITNRAGRLISHQARFSLVKKQSHSIEALTSWAQVVFIYHPPEFYQRGQGRILHMASIHSFHLDCFGL